MYSIAARINSCFFCLFVYSLAPVGPPQVYVANISTTWIKIVLEPPFDPENLTRSFGLTYQLLNTSHSLSTPRPQVTLANINKQPPTFTLQPLLQASLYRIVVYAVTEQGISPGSDGLLVATKESRKSLAYNSQLSLQK